MIRLALMIALALALGPMALAAGLGKDDCRATRDILSAAVAARKAGANAETVKAQLTRGDGAVEARYAATVAPLVDLVFALERAALSDRIAEQYERQCLQYDP